MCLVWKFKINSSLLISLNRLIGMALWNITFLLVEQSQKVDLEEQECPVSADKSATLIMVQTDFRHDICYAEIVVQAPNIGGTDSDGAVERETIQVSFDGATLSLVKEHKLQANLVAKVVDNISNGVAESVADTRDIIQSDSAIENVTSADVEVNNLAILEKLLSKSEITILKLRKNILKWWQFMDRTSSLSAQDWHLIASA